MTWNLKIKLADYGESRVSCASLELAERDQQKDFLSSMLDFLERYENCFSREQLYGHFTGSALIVSPAAEEVLLIHHRKLEKWLQPGGHADGDENLFQVARREAEEETGLANLEPALGEKIFDLDVHRIPARSEEPEHFHFDVRFLFVADRESHLIAQEQEVSDIAWFLPAEVDESKSDGSVIRLIARAQSLLASS